MELGMKDAAEARIKQIDGELKHATTAVVERTKLVADISGLKGDRKRLDEQRGSLGKLKTACVISEDIRCPLPAADRHKADEHWRNRLDQLSAEIAKKEHDLPAPIATDALDQERMGLLRRVSEIDRYTVERAETEALLADLDTRLKGLPEANGPDPQIAKLEERIGNGRIQLGAAKELIRHIDEYAAYSAARRDLDAEVADLETLVRALGPKGLKEKLLVERLAGLQQKVNAALGPFGLSVEYGEEPWEVRVNHAPPKLMARSELFRAGICHEIALAAVTGVRWICVDGADLLDERNRAALFTLLRQAIEAKVLDQALVFATSSIPPFGFPMTNHITYFAVERQGQASSVRRL
jgi:hypothetical protein